MKFLALDHDDIEIELIRIALREHGPCEFADSEDDLIEKVKASKIDGEVISAIFIYPGNDQISGFETLRRIRELEDLHEDKIQVLFLCNNKNTMFFMDMISKSTESFVSKNIIKREILETLISKKVIK